MLFFYVALQKLFIMRLDLTNIELIKTSIYTRFLFYKKIWIRENSLNMIIYFLYDCSFYYLFFIVFLFQKSVKLGIMGHIISFMVGKWAVGMERV